MMTTAIQTLHASVRRHGRDYLELTKPKVVALITFTAMVGMLLATPGRAPWEVLLFGSAGIALMAGSAAALNHLADRLERDTAHHQGDHRAHHDADDEQHKQRKQRLMPRDFHDVDGIHANQQERRNHDDDGGHQQNRKDDDRKDDRQAKPMQQRFFILVHIRFTAL